ncbi:MAG: hypothetical protein H7Y07_16810 [Pyrinomonadaceae bacterium]|nr:hypothetical protein [Sphingobacteriaceae bacterium]
MHKAKFMSHVFLSHLSKDNNCPKLVEELFTRQAGSTKVIVASRDQETAVYEIGPGISNILTKKTFIDKPSLQYSLF